jgi:hypothetical protein
LVDTHEPCNPNAGNAFVLCRKDAQFAAWQLDVAPHGGVDVLRVALGASLIINPCSGPDGEIGRHTGLKILRLKGRAGSIPAPGTNLEKLPLRDQGRLFCFPI